MSLQNSINKGTSIAAIKKEYRQKLTASIERRLSNEWGIGLAECLNLKLQLMALQADIVLDLHNGPVSTRQYLCTRIRKRLCALF